LAHHLDGFSGATPEMFLDLNAKERKRIRIRILAALMRLSFARNCVPPK
jgi:hypothetical protein